MALVTNTGHMAEMVLLQPGNRLLKAPTEIDAARLAPLREFYLADLKSDQGMSGGPVYLVESGAVIGVVQGYTQDLRLAVLVPTRNIIALLKGNNVAFEELPAGKSDRTFIARSAAHCIYFRDCWLPECGRPYGHIARCA